MSIHSQADQLIPGLPAKYFTDSDVFQQISEEVFYKTWQLACHSSQVANVGDFFCFSILDQDLFVIRGRDGKLRALYNVCQHRGHTLLSGQGNRKLVTCPYHAWSYDLDGQLKVAPNSNAVNGFDKGNICVPQVRLEEFLGFVFVNLDDDADSMDECYPGVKQSVQALCPNVSELKFAYEHAINEGCNWLTAVENYNECYHCKVAHKDFAEGIIDPGSYNIAPFGDGKVLHHSSKATQSDAAWYDVSGSDYGSFFLWPMTSLQFYPGGVMNTYHWRPVSVDDVRVYRGWYSIDGNVDETLQKVIDLDRDTTFAEDLVLVKNVQRGLNSKGYRPGPLIVDQAGGIDNELSIACLHSWLKEAVG